VVPRATSFECPRSTCDGFFYLRSDKHWRELWCPKCGFLITLAPEEKSELEPKPESLEALWPWSLVAVLIAAFIAFLIFR
jgi:hypothetical protein